MVFRVLHRERNKFFCKEENGRVIPSEFMSSCFPSEPIICILGSEFLNAEPVDSSFLLDEGSFFDTEVILVSLHVIVRQIKLLCRVVPALRTVIKLSNGILAGAECFAPEHTSRHAPTVLCCRDVRINGDFKYQTVRPVRGQYIITERTPEMNIIDRAGGRTPEIIGKKECGHIYVYTRSAEIRQLRPVHLMGIIRIPVAFIIAYTLQPHWAYEEAGWVAVGIINLSLVLVLIGITWRRRFVRNHTYEPFRNKRYESLVHAGYFNLNKHVEKAVGSAARCERRKVQYTRRVVNLFGYLAQRRHVGDNSKVHLPQRWT